MSNLLFSNQEMEILNIFFQMYKDLQSPDFLNEIEEMIIRQAMADTLSQLSSESRIAFLSALENFEKNNIGFKCLPAPDEQ